MCWFSFGWKQMGQIMKEVYEGRVQGREGAAMFINHRACDYLCTEVSNKGSTSVRGPLEKAALVSAGAQAKALAGACQIRTRLP